MTSPKNRHVWRWVVGLSVGLVLLAVGVVTLVPNLITDAWLASSVQKTLNSDWKSQGMKVSGMRCHELNQGYAQNLDIYRCNYIITSDGYSMNSSSEVRLTGNFWTKWKWELVG